MRKSKKKRSMKWPEMQGMRAVDGLLEQSGINKINRTNDVQEKEAPRSKQSDKRKTRVPMETRKKRLGGEAQNHRQREVDNSGNTAEMRRT